LRGLIQPLPEQYLLHVWREKKVLIPSSPKSVGPKRPGVSAFASKSFVQIPAVITASQRFPRRFLRARVSMC